MRVLSYGGGTQSAALALMSASGELPRLDAVIFADTKGELPETYTYAEYVKAVLDKAGIPFLVVSRGSLEEALLSETPTPANPTPPAFVLAPDGTKGRVSQYRCSFDFKRRLVTRAVKQLCGPRGAWKHATVEQWIGYSADELGRVKQSNECRCGHPMQRHRDGGCERCSSCQRFDRWQINVHPLIDLGFRRQDTIRWFAEHGHPAPPRSACFFCPASSDVRWRELRSSHPELWERACAIDAFVRDGNAAFNRRGRQPLRGKVNLPL